MASMKGGSRWRVIVRAALALTILLLAGCLTPRGVGPISGEAIAFGAPVEVSAGTDGAEPSMAIDPDGRIFVTSMHIGHGFPYVSNVWRSVDEGATWQALDPNRPLAGNAGAGGGDESIAIGADGTVALTDLSGQGSTALTSRDHGATWTVAYVTSSGPVFLEDREWNAIDKEGRLYIVGRDYQPGVTAWVARSDDHGATWRTVGSPWNGATGPDGFVGYQDSFLLVDPNDALRLAYACATVTGARTGFCLATSRDQGATWTSTLIESVPTDQSEGGFATIAADNAGTLYAAWSDARSGEPDIWMSTSGAGARWSAPARVTSEPGTRVFPTMTAGAAGRVAIAWYETPSVGDPNDHTAMRDASWHVEVATTSNARNAAPAWAFTPASAETHRGTLGTRGVPLRNINPPDRSLGDYFTLAADAHGRLSVAFVEATNAPGKILVARQSAGPMLR